MKRLETKLEAIGSEQTALSQRIADLHAEVKGLGRGIELACRHLVSRRSPLPPDHLQTRQVGSPWGNLFFSEGKVIFRQIQYAFSANGLPLEQAVNVLDFGCGCGRVFVGFEDCPTSGEIWGSDVDEEAIIWNRANLGHIGQFFHNGDLPPLRFPDGFFSAIYCVSVFTHLPEDMQIEWLKEMRRLLRPGGLLLASVHGEHYWAADHGVKAEVEARGFAYRRGERTSGLPDYYMVAFHSEEYVRSTWGRYLEVVDYKRKLIHSLHDAAILRRGP